MDKDLLKDKLLKLLQQWNDEKLNFIILSKRFNDSVSTLSQLNTEIYNICKKEKIDIETLNM